VEQRKNFKELLYEDQDDIKFYEAMRKRQGDKILVNKKSNGDRHFTKENLHDFIAKKSEMFLVQYALGVKRQEMQKLEEIAQGEEQTILDDEKALEEDAAKFDAFLKENDKNSVEAIKRAEAETKGKLEKIQDIKKLNVHIMNIKSEMSKNEDQLKDLQRYKHFLDLLTPDDSTAVPATGAEKGKDLNLRNLAHSASADRETEDWEDIGDKPLLYFKSPQQLLDLFAELEENNLSLIQNCQETEETLEDLKEKIRETEDRMYLYHD
jgi:hypothetical protein